MKRAVASLIFAAIALAVIVVASFQPADRAEGPTGAIVALGFGLILALCGIVSGLWAMRHASGTRRRIAFAGFLASVFAIIALLGLGKVNST